MAPTAGGRPHGVSTRAFKRFFRGSFRVPYPFFVELVELVKQRDWFPTGQEDAVGRPCIPVELKVSRTDCHDSYKEKRGRLHATTVSEYSQYTRRYIYTPSSINT